MLYTTVRCRLNGDKMVLSNGVTEYLKKDYKIFGDFFATCKKNYHGSYDLVRILKITSENTLEEERGVN